MREKENFFLNGRGRRKVREKENFKRMGEGEGK
jgi:hypothetical protein